MDYQSSELPNRIVSRASIPFQAPRSCWRVVVSARNTCAILGYVRFLGVDVSDSSVGRAMVCYHLIAVSRLAQSRSHMGAGHTNRKEEVKCEYVLLSLMIAGTTPLDGQPIDDPRQTRR